MAIMFDDTNRWVPDDYQQEELNRFLNNYYGRTHDGLLGTLPNDDENPAMFTDAAQFLNSGAPEQPQVPELPQGIVESSDEGGLQLQEPQTPAAPTPQQGVEDLKGMLGSASETAAEMGREGQEQANSLIANAGAKRQALTQASQQAAQQALQQNKGGGLLGSLLKIGINTALGNWLGGVGSKALGTFGNALNKAFKIKGVGAK